MRIILVKFQLFLIHHPYFREILNNFPLFSALLTADVDDVREVMSYYKQFADPIEAFRDNQRKLLEQMEEKQREEQQKAPAIVKKWTPSFLSHK